MALLALLCGDQNLFQLSEGIGTESQHRDRDSNAFPIHIFHFVNSLDVSDVFFLGKVFTREVGECPGFMFLAPPLNRARK